MKKLLFFIVLLFSLPAFSQFCGFDEVMKEVEAKNPQLKKERLAHEEAVRKEGIQNVLKRLGYLNKKTGKPTNTIYEIPVVVHVMEPSYVLYDMPTDLEIVAWIDQANQILATTYGNGYYTDGEGIDAGTKFPFKIVLAKRDPNCNSTNGIIRYDANDIPYYNFFGVPDNHNIPQEFFNIAPHWDENTYLNIYIVNKIYDANSNTKDESNTAAWAAFPSFNNENYHIIAKKNSVLNDSYVLAHEFGHTLGLLHTFEGVDIANFCQALETPENCNSINDFVCDTEPAKNFGSVPLGDLPSNTDINPCTNKHYEGVQYNIMNYCNSHRKFTPNQRDRAISEFLDYRANLVFSSKALIPPDGISVAEPIVSCNPTQSVCPAVFNYVGPKSVRLGNIDNSSTAFISSWANFYQDFTKNNCRYKNVTTHLNTGNNHLEIDILSFQQKIRAWIDFNNDGQFSDDEKIVSDDSTHLFNELGPTTLNYSFTIPQNVTYNTSLRLRIKADDSDNLADVNNPCSNIFEGQVEDYIVIIDKPGFAITTTVNPVNSGTVSGAGSYLYGDLVTLTAQPNEGYEFVNWSQDNQEVSTQIVYTFGAYADRNLVANFRKIFNLNLSAFPANGGAVSGAGTYVPNTVVNVSATSNYGYSFVNWTENGTEISTSPTISVTLNSSRNLRANFTNSSSANSSINQYQYWYDGNYNANTEVHINSVSNLQLYDSFTGTENLSPGLHDVTFRAKDNQGNWSATVRAYFVIHSKLNELQYWFDDDFSNPQTLPASGSRDITFITDFPTNNLNFGLHKINLRSLDNAGKWSSVTSSFFYKKPSLEKAEYWIDNQYNSRVSVPIADEVFFFNQSVFVGSLDDKLHTITFRTKDQSGKWSSAISAYFMNKSKIVGYEYWLNEDYNSKNYTTVTPTDFLEESFNVNVYQFNYISGTNILHFRAKNNFGKWSSTIDTEFTMGGTLGVEVIKNEKNILLYPNPFEDFITIQSKNTEILQVALFDTSGKMVKQLQNINKKEYKLEGSNLPSSMYILVVVTKDAKQSFKVIKK